MVASKLFASSLLFYQISATASPDVVQRDGVGAASLPPFTICNWQQPRAAMIRNMIYMDGGQIYVPNGQKDGIPGFTDVQSLNLNGAVLAYNLSMPFTKATNLTDLLFKNAVYKGSGSEGDDAALKAPYFDGGMLANDAEFFLFGGGLLYNDATFNRPGSQEILRYARYQYGENKPAFSSGFSRATLDKDVSRFVTYGAAVSAPSENKAWYFSGMKTPSGGLFDQNPGLNSTTFPNVTANQIVQVDFNPQYGEKWTTTKLPDNIKGRSNAEVVWVPVGDQGILVVLGGAVYPEWAGENSHQSDNATRSAAESPRFIETIDVYDVAGGSWYKQNTTGGPTGTRARGCAVVAAAKDASSYNIYYYGGYDGLNITEPFYDEMWVLSVPSFTWTMVNSGTPDHGRAGHKCFKPYPDQMMIVGGFATLGSCVKDGVVAMFNLSSAEWMDGYDPVKYSDYQVPKPVVVAVHGNGDGGAEVVAPSVGWDEKALGAVFAKKYDTSKIHKFWPYQAANNGTSGDQPSTSSGLPKWVAPVIGVIVALFVISALALGWCFWRRKLRFKNSSNASSSEIPTENGLRIMSWIKGQPTAEMQNNQKQQFVATESSVGDPSTTEPSLMRERDISLSVSPTRHMSESTLSHEMADTQLAELPDTSTPVELQGIGLTPLDIVKRKAARSALRSSLHSHPSQAADSLKRQESMASSFVTTDSSLAGSRDSSPLVGQAVPATTSNPFAGHIAYQQQQRIASPHLQDLDSPTIPLRVNISPLAPISPPSAGEFGGDDYITAGARASKQGAPASPKDPGNKGKK